MKFYIIKIAIYLHGVYGPYDTREDAIAAFNEAYEKSPTEEWGDFDGHHKYYIVHGLGNPVGSNNMNSSEETDYEITYKAKKYEK